MSAPSAVRAADGAAAVNLPAGALREALQQLGISRRIGLLYAPDVVGERRSPRVSGAMTVEQALDQLLAGTGLAYRRTTADTFVIFATEAASPPVALPELLVVGRRTQNADIRRSENDIQPYQVFTAGVLGAAHADSVDQFLRTRLASNGALFGPSSDPGAAQANNRSEINLHGLGPSQTLILVDGARMPSVPDIAALEMRQPDINGLPLFAVERIETLTSTAGGIHGPGSTGGVVNVVLRRDYHGADLALTYGIADRGDAARRRIDGRMGFTPDDGATDIMFAFSRAEADALPQGRRSYALASRRIRFARDPAGFVATAGGGDAILVRSLDGTPLQLAAPFGGASLGSTFTVLPTGRSADTGDFAATVLANAGQISPALAPDSGGSERSLVSDTAVTALLLNVRRRFGDRVEAFVDVLGYQNNGQALSGDLQPNRTVVSSFRASNPFRQTVVVTYPTPQAAVVGRTRLRTHRISAGLIADLPRGWKANATVAEGGVRLASATAGSFLDETGALSGAPGRPPLDPFGDWTSFLQTVSNYSLPVSTGVSSRVRFRDLSVRLAGPVATTRAGDVALTLLAERRTETVPTYTQVFSIAGEDTPISAPGFTERVDSAYGELRVPLYGPAEGPVLLRGLELQFAARYDRNRTVIPTLAGEVYRADQSAPAYTVGLKLFPRPRLMARGSLSTGVLPPTPVQLLPDASLMRSPLFDADPKRGGRLLGSEGPYLLSSRGSLSLAPEKAQAISVGLVFNPDGVDWPRISLDATRIRKRDEIIRDFGGRASFILANEALFPERVVRAPLTDADRAAGFTGGVITSLDASYLNIGRTWSDAIDLKLDYTRRLPGESLLQVHAGATWQPRLTRQIAPDRAKEHHVGFAEGPLEWRGAASVTWSRGRLSMTLSGQYYDGYKAIAFPGTVLPGAPDRPLYGELGVDIPPQAYFDASAAYVFEPSGGPARTIEARLGVQNLLDHQPPIVTNTVLGYSSYGDPRRRRFEASLRARF